jgi:carbon monoxide dehydrogenase subunit G
MPTARFERTLDVNSSAEDTWKVLTDVQRVGGWVSVVGAVEEIEPLATYKTTLTDRLGPFRLHADLDVKVVELEEGRRIRLRAEGRDRQVGTHLSVDAELTLLTEDGRTRIAVSGSYSVVGSVAAMGAGTIRKKADTIIEEFFTAAADALS